MHPLAIVWQWPETPIAILTTIVVAVLARWLILRAIRSGTESATRRAERRRQGETSRAGRLLAEATGMASERYAARTATMGSLLRSVTNAVVVTLAVLTIMAILEIPLAPLLASAGVGGIALGFGAQSLVKDYLSGVFMIAEDQYGVGDLIDVGEVTGTVEEVGLRVTRLRDLSGKVWYVRNGEIVRVGNQSQGWSTAIVDVPVAHNEDAAKVVKILEQVMDEIDADEAWSAQLLERPTVAGVHAVSGGTMTIRVFAKTPPNEHWAVQREILERSVTALGKAGVRGPVIIPGTAT